MTEHQAPSRWLQRWQTLIDRIIRVQSHLELQPLLKDLRSGQTPKILAFVNAHAMNSVAQSPEFYQAIVNADLIVRDGTGMRTLFKMLALPPGLNLNGTDLIPKIISQFNGAPIALYGTRDPYLARARDAIRDSLAPASKISTTDGFQSTEAYIALARQQRPALIVLGMGMPKQEQVAAAMRTHLEHPCLIVCGGAIIDFMGGKTPRAPLWMRKMGSEWVYRLALEPNRLFQRYVVGNPVFLLRAIYLTLNRSVPAVDHSRTQD